MLDQKNLPTINFEALPKTLAIVGSRSFTNSKAASETMSKLIHRFVKSLPSETEIVSGGAAGIDDYAAKAAAKHRLPLIEFLPDPEIPSPQRYFQRNRDMVDYVKRRGGAVIAFVDEGSMRGTQMTVTYARRQNVPRLLLRFGRTPLRILGIDEYDLHVLE